MYVMLTDMGSWMVHVGDNFFAYLLSECLSQHINRADKTINSPMSQNWEGRLFFPGQWYLDINIWKGQTAPHGNLAKQEQTVFICTPYV